jgi:1-acyl-sn-glycerol-3-phosphate acyltransferase
MFKAPPILGLSEVEERLSKIDLKFNRLGFDKLGISRRHLKWFYQLMGLFYFHYFKVSLRDEHFVPSQGRCMLIGNHSGGIPVDGGMLSAALFFGLDTPRHPHGMVEKFAQNVPFLSSLFSRMGQLTGLPEHAKLLLDDERLLVVFPEGVRGIGKLWSQRYQLERFGTGFMRIALETQTPIVPFAFIGGEEAFPTMFHLKRLARLSGVPYIPIPKHLIPLPKPVACRIHFGKPLHFSGDGSEADDIIESYVSEVQEEIKRLIRAGRAESGYTQ